MQCPPVVPCKRQIIKTIFVKFGSDEGNMARILSPHADPLAAPEPLRTISFRGEARVQQVANWAASKDGDTSLLRQYCRRSYPRPDAAITPGRHASLAD